MDEARPIPPRSAASLRPPHEPNISACVRLRGAAACQAEQSFHATSGRFGYVCHAPACPVRAVAVADPLPPLPKQTGGSLYRPPARKRR